MSYRKKIEIGRVKKQIEPESKIPNEKEGGEGGEEDSR